VYLYCINIYREVGFGEQVLRQFNFPTSLDCLSPIVVRRLT